jgi:hypothetical protein
MTYDASAKLSGTLKAAFSKPLGEGGDLRMTAALTGRHPAEIVEALGLWPGRLSRHVYFC